MEIQRLLEGNNSLFDENPSNIAGMVANKLNVLDRANQDIIAVTAIPDYHTFGLDGGVKDILFIVQPKTPLALKLRWTTSLLRGQGSMYGWETPDIQARLKTALAELNSKGYTMKHLITLTDSHSFVPMFQGVGGMDGLKDIILCYHRKLPSHLK